MYRCIKKTTTATTNHLLFKNILTYLYIFSLGGVVAFLACYASDILMVMMRNFIVNQDNFDCYYKFLINEGMHVRHTGFLGLSV